MKTIEEQIEEFARKLTPCGMCNENSDGVGCKVEIMDCAWRKDIYKAFAEIAKLQREIDINKACKWFESYLAEIGYPDDWCRDSEVQASGKERFIKAMEEEL